MKLNKKYKKPLLSAKLLCRKLYYALTMRKEDDPTCVRLGKKLFNKPGQLPGQVTSVLRNGIVEEIEEQLKDKGYVTRVEELNPHYSRVWYYVHPRTTIR